MNTLSKEITRTYFYNEEQENYDKLRKVWSELANDENKKHLLGLREHILYLVFLGKDWRKAITIATNKNKLANGYKPAYISAFWGLNTYNFNLNIKQLFGNLFTEEQFNTAVGLINVPKDWKDFGKVDAYKDIA